MQVSFDKLDVVLYSNSNASEEAYMMFVWDIGHVTTYTSEVYHDREGCVRLRESIYIFSWTCCIAPCSRMKNCLLCAYTYV